MGDGPLNDGFHFYAVIQLVLEGDVKSHELPAASQHRSSSNHQHWIRTGQRREEFHLLKMRLRGGGCFWRLRGIAVVEQVSVFGDG